MRWISFPKNIPPSENFRSIVKAFEDVENEIASSPRKKMESNKVLEAVRPGLESLGYIVEKSKRADDKIHVPVLFGENGVEEKYFEADAFHADKRTVIEVEAGRAVTNFQFLKDFFEACMMQDVDYLCIAVRNEYMNGATLSKDFEKVVTYFETLYLSDRIKIALKGILVIGY
ncbi:MAG: hypothetical protein J6O73_14890 [Lachnospiraceae bacterium]|nr:hypothetical protein [Lachnospiraceae bacterium]